MTKILFVCHGKSPLPLADCNRLRQIGANCGNAIGG